MELVELTPRLRSEDGLIHPESESNSDSESSEPITGSDSAIDRSNKLYIIACILVVGFVLLLSGTVLSSVAYVFRNTGGPLPEPTIRVKVRVRVRVRVRV